MTKILVPFRWYQKDVLTYLVLAFDVFACTSLLIFTGGLSSGFLLYSLSPILTIALVAKRRVALSAAAITSLSIVGIQLFSSHFNLYVSPRLDSPNEYLGIMVVYILVCFLAAILPFLINANTRQGIEERATMDERNRLAREMHDGLAQDTAYLKMKVAMLRNSLSPENASTARSELGEMGVVIDNMHADLREALGLLRLRAPASIGLTAALADHVHEFGQRTGIRTEIFVADGQTKLSTLAELHTIRLVQEALTSIRKHANATKVEVRIEEAGKWTSLTIRDNGQGFDPTPYLNRQGDGEHVGLKVMRERVEELGGELKITSKPGQGTELLFQIPIGLPGGQK
jgi:signal transduction histidine kinase